MTEGNPAADHIRRRMKVGAQISQMAMNQINVIAGEAADVDKAGKWGIDGWIRTIHDLIDLQVRTTAAVLSASVAGPWWAEPADESPDPSEPIAVPHPEYARTMTATGFTRIGRPGESIPDYCIDLQPDILAPGQTEVRVGLTDYRYAGANYRGKIVWRRTTGTPAETGELEVTVGL